MPPFLHCRWAAGKQDRLELEPVQTRLRAGDAPSTGTGRARALRAPHPIPHLPRRAVCSPKKGS